MKSIVKNNHLSISNKQNFITISIFNTTQFKFWTDLFLGILWQKQMLEYLWKLIHFKINLKAFFMPLLAIFDRWKIRCPKTSDDLLICHCILQQASNMNVTILTFHLLVAEEANRLLYILEIVSMSDMLATPLPSFPTKWALVPQRSNSAVGNCLVPNLSFNLTICMLLSWSEPGCRVLR